MEKHILEQSLLDEYNDKFEAYICVCHLMEDVDKEVYELALRKAAGVKMLRDYLIDNNII